MSVINKMLQDLEKRQQDPAPKVSEDVLKDLPVPKKTQSLGRLMWHIMTLVLIIGLIWMLYPAYIAPYFSDSASYTAQSNDSTDTDTIHEIPSRNESEALNVATASSVDTPSKHADANKQVEHASISSNSEINVANNDSTIASSDLPAKEAEVNEALTAEVDSESAKESTNSDVQSEAEPHSTELLANTAKPQRSALAEDAGKQPVMRIETVEVTPELLANKAYQEGMSLRNRGLVLDAIETYRKALNTYPKHLDARKQLAALYYGRNMTTEALQVLNDGIQVTQNHVELSLIAAKICFKSDDYQCVIDYLTPFTIESSSLELIALRANAYQANNEHLQAFNDFSLLAELYPENGRWVLGQAVTADQAGNTQQALLAYRKLLSLGGISADSRRYAMQRIQSLGVTNDG